MPKRGVIALITTALALALLLGFKTPAEMGDGADVPPRIVIAASPGTTAIGRTAGPVVAPSGSPAPAGGVANVTPPTPGDATAGSTAKREITGPIVSTRFGPVQVQVTLAGSTITDVTAIELPSGRRSGQISGYAAPILHDEALQAQSAKVDIVSGATYTSLAYERSLQAALDAAG